MPKSWEILADILSDTAAVAYCDIHHAISCTLTGIYKGILLFFPWMVNNVADIAVYTYIVDTFVLWAGGASCEFSRGPSV